MQGGRPKASLEVRALAGEHTAEALHTIVEIMRNSRSDSVRLATAEAIFDRGWGRPAPEITGPGKGLIQVEAIRLAADSFVSASYASLPAWQGDHLSSADRDRDAQGRSSYRVGSTYVLLDVEL